VPVKWAHRAARASVLPTGMRMFMDILKIAGTPSVENTTRVRLALRFMSCLKKVGN